MEKVYLHIDSGRVKMEASTIHEIALNLATNSPFVGFLVWNWWYNTRQLEQYRLEMKADRDEYERKREEGIEKIRLRYVKVIEDLKSDKKDGIEERLTSMEKAIKKLFVMIDKLKDEINELKLKDRIRNG